MPFSDHAADVCLVLNALHCVPDPQAAVTEAVRCLAPGGCLLGSKLIRGGSPRADRLLDREMSRPNGTAGPGGTLVDLERWLHLTGLTGVEVVPAGAMAVFQATSDPERERQSDVGA